MGLDRPGRRRSAGGDAVERHFGMLLRASHGRALANFSRSESITLLKLWSARGRAGRSRSRFSLTRMGRESVPDVPQRTAPLGCEKPRMDAATQGRRPLRAS